MVLTIFSATIIFHLKEDNSTSYVACFLSNKYDENNIISMKW
jgi:hypothetical protein